LVCLDGESRMHLIKIVGRSILFYYSTHFNYSNRFIVF
jgi:hypothetical protein